MNTQSTTSTQADRVTVTPRFAKEVLNRPALLARPRPAIKRTIQPSRGSTYHFSITGPNAQTAVDAGELSRSSHRSHVTGARLPAAQFSSGPILVGDRKMLRALRAAEMAAWEAALPSTEAGQKSDCADMPCRTVQLPTHTPYRKEGWLFLALAASASLGLIVGIEDLFNLFANWARIAEGVKLLLR